MEPKLSARDRIFQAARERIKHYGFNKTTMAEIAADCGMSPGNIYRFFEAKIDIAEAIVRHYFSEQNTRFSAIARRSDLPADQRLHDMLSTRMHDVYRAMERDPKMLEMATSVHGERPNIRAEQEAHERVFISQILKDGVRAGLFDIEEPDFVAEMIQVATQKFIYAQNFSDTPLPQLEREFEGVMGLLLRAIIVRAPQRAAVGGIEG